jgi:hypothetical protein
LNSDVTREDIRLLVHLEMGDDGAASWWAESPDVPGFSAVSNSLSDVQIRSQWAIMDILGESDRRLGQLLVRLVPTPLETANPVSVERSDESGPVQRDANPSDVRVATAVLTAA